MCRHSRRQDWSRNCSFRCDVEELDNAIEGLKKAICNDPHIGEKPVRRLENFLLRISKGLRKT